MLLVLESVIFLQESNRPSNANDYFPSPQGCNAGFTMIWNFFLHISEQVPKTLLGIFLDQCEHTLYFYQYLSSTTHRATYVWHNRFSIAIPDISKRHLNAFILVNMKLGVVDVLNLIKGYCRDNVNAPST